MAVLGSLKHAWNAFLNQKPVENLRSSGFGVTTYGGSPSRVRLNSSNERSIISSIYTRLAIDIASTEIRHVRLDKERRYADDMDSGLNECLTVEANIDQAATAIKQDWAMTLFDAGVSCLVPIDTSLDPEEPGTWDIKTLRVGTVTQWFPDKVRVNIYNEATGRREEVTLPKRIVAIVENPLYSVMNEPNSTLQRLIRKINLLDIIDEQSSSGKLDIIIQLPYVIKSNTRRQQAEQRRKDIEFQLKGSKYGIAYTDGTEKITQLNRPAENNLMGQIEMLVKMLYSQLGLTEGVMNGTAKEEEMLNYHNRTVEPLVRALVEEMRRKFLTKTARTQLQWILYFRDPFKLIPVGQIAEMADKFARNEIVTSNEVRGFIGLKPSKDPKADQLINSNMPTKDTGVAPPTPETDDGDEELAREIDSILSEVDV